MNVVLRPEMDIDIDNLIKEVEKRPGLYHTGSPDYHDRNKKKILWKEICSQLNNKWATQNTAEKTIFSKEVQKKWNSLRDCFRRELLIQRNTPSGGGMKKKVKYRYFNALLFLKPFTQGKINESTVDNEYIGMSAESNPTYAHPIEKNGPNLNKKRKTINNQDVLLSALTVENTKKNNDVTTVQENNVGNITEDNNDDRLFLLSLLPSFKDCTMDEKYLMRIEIMRTIMKCKQSQREMENLSSLATGQTVDSEQHSPIEINETANFLGYSEV